MSKPGELLKAKDSVLLLVDIQEKFRPVLPGFENVVRGGRILLQAAEKLAIPAMASEQYPQALGRTVEELRSFLLDAGAYFPKMCFSAKGCEPILTRLHRTGRRQVVLVGVEAHVCVLQTAVELTGAGFSVHVAADAVASRSGYDRDLALRRMEIGGVSLVTIEMVIFEWLRAAGTPEFKELQALVK